MKNPAILLLALGLGSCLHANVDLQPIARPRAHGQVVRYDLTYDAQNQNPRMRWIVQLAAPLKVEGWHRQEYAQVKVFGLADTTTYRVGTKLSFEYQLVPQVQQTPWLTNYERYAVPAYPPGYVPNPELVLHLVQIL